MARCFVPLALLFLAVLSNNNNIISCWGGRLHLKEDYYEQMCPQALPTIRRVVQRAIHRENRMGASLIRMHFHDCFVNGCDGSILLDDTDGFVGEKKAAPNFQSVRGFQVIDKIKEAVGSVCGANVVSCADIVAVAARDSVHALGGPDYQVQLGRRDARTASQGLANTSIPDPFLNFTALLSNFKSKGLNVRDLVALSGAHTVGLAHCFTFRDRIYNETQLIHQPFARNLRKRCPLEGGDDNLAHLDGTASRFDLGYFDRLVKRRGLLHTDQELYKGFETSRRSARLVEHYRTNVQAFWKDFGASMIKMGNIKPLTGNAGEIRRNCRKVNS